LQVTRDWLVFTRPRRLLLAQHTSCKANPHRHSNKTNLHQPHERLVLRQPRGLVLAQRGADVVGVGLERVVELRDVEQRRVDALAEVCMPERIENASCEH
jgi:hypothetical protein